MIPPKKTARLQKSGKLPCLEERDKAICRIKELGEEGRSQWKKEIGYHRRSRVETCIFRYKTIMDDRLSARKWENQTTEIQIKMDVLNRMTELGMPKKLQSGEIKGDEDGGESAQEGFMQQSPFKVQSPYPNSTPQQSHMS